MRGILMAVSLLTGCSTLFAPPAPDYLLQGMKPGQTVELGEVLLFRDQAPLLSVAGSVTAAAEPTVTFSLDGVTLPATVMRTGGRWTFLLETPVAIEPGEHSSLGELKLNGTTAATWPVTWTVVNPELKVCHAGLPGEVEDLTAPLTHCVDANTPDSPVLPNLFAQALTKKRVRFTVKRAEVKVQSIQIGSSIQVGPQHTVTADKPLELEVLPNETLRIGTGFLAPPYDASKKPIAELAQTATLLKARVGSTTSLTLTLTSSRDGVVLTGIADDRGQFTAGTVLPLVLTKNASVNVTVNYRPTTLGNTQTLALRFTDADGTAKTDRVKLDATGVPSSACTLTVGDLDLGQVVVGERKAVLLDVKNVGSAPCTRLRVTSPSRELTIDSATAPMPGQTAQWRAWFSSTQAGMQTAVLEARVDDELVTQPDLAVRVQATVTP